MRKIEMNINCKAKDILNKMIEERNGEGGTYVSRKIHHVNYQLKSLSAIFDTSLRKKLIQLLINDHKNTILSESYVSEDMKSHLANFIDTIGKTYIRKIDNYYVIYDPETLKRPDDKLYRTLKSVNRGLKRQQHLNNKTYQYTTQYDLKQLQYQNK
jgi:hypothetical protein